MTTTTQSFPVLTYFAGRGTGQLARVLLAYLNVPYVNNVVDKIEDREKLPFGQLPVYQEGDFTLAQSTTIARYIAAKNNFLGKTLEEQYTVDSIVTALGSDLLTQLNPALLDKEKLANVILPRTLGKFESTLKEKKYLVGDSYTLADLYAYVAYDYFQFVGLGELVNAEKYPQIEELKKYFESNAGVIEYIKNRPITKY